MTSSRPTAGSVQGNNVKTPRRRKPADTVPDKVDRERAEMNVVEDDRLGYDTDRRVTPPDFNVVEFRFKLTDFRDPVREIWHMDAGMVVRGLEMFDLPEHGVEAG